MDEGDRLGERKNGCVMGLTEVQWVLSHGKHGKSVNIQVPEACYRKNSSKQGKQRQVCKEAAHWACSQ